MKRKKYRRTDMSHLSPREIYRKWHWGKNPTYRAKVPIPGLSENHPVNECGLLTEIHIDPFRNDLPLPSVIIADMTNEAAEKPTHISRLTEIAIDPVDYNNNHLVFDIRHPDQRLYPVLSKSSMQDAARALWKKGERTYTPYQLAREVGGRHAQQNDYPRVRVQPLGIIYYVTYYTWKEDEKGKPSPSKYIHRMGEEGGIEPILAVSKSGHLFICGGTYTCPWGGVTQ